MAIALVNCHYVEGYGVAKPYTAVGKRNLYRVSCCYS